MGVQTYIFFIHLRRFLINLSNHCLVNQLFRDAVSEQPDDQEFCIDGFWVDRYRVDEPMQQVLVVCTNRQLRLFASKRRNIEDGSALEELVLDMPRMIDGGGVYDRIGAITRAHCRQALLISIYQDSNKTMAVHKEIWLFPEWGFSERF